MQAIDDIPPIDDRSHDATRSELCRLFVQHKADLGLGDRSDNEIVSGVDRIAAYLFDRHGRALLAGDTAWLERFAWFGQACDRLSDDQPAVKLDG